MKCLGGRELRGALRGYDELVNLVLDDCEEFIRGEYNMISVCCILLFVAIVFLHDIYAFYFCMILNNCTHVMIYEHEHI